MRDGPRRKLYCTPRYYDLQTKREITATGAAKLSARLCCLNAAAAIDLLGVTPAAFLKRIRFTLKPRRLVYVNCAKQKRPENTYLKSDLLKAGEKEAALRMTVAGIGDADPDLIHIDAAAAELRCSYMTIRRLAEAGKLTEVRRYALNSQLRPKPHTFLRRSELARLFIPAPDPGQPIIVGHGSTEEHWYLSADFREQFETGSSFLTYWSRHASKLHAGKALRKKTLYVISAYGYPKKRTAWLGDDAVNILAGREGTNPMTGRGHGGRALREALAEKIGTFVDALLANGPCFAIHGIRQAVNQKICLVTLYKVMDQMGIKRLRLDYTPPGWQPLKKPTVWYRKGQRLANLRWSSQGGPQHIDAPEAASAGQAREAATAHAAAVADDPGAQGGSFHWRNELTKTIYMFCYLHRILLRESLKDVRKSAARLWPSGAPSEPANVRRYAMLFAEREGLPRSPPENERNLLIARITEDLNKRLKNKAFSL